MNIHRYRDFGFLLVVFLLVFWSVSPLMAARVQLYEGDTIQVRFDSKLKISSGVLKKGDKIPIVLDQPIVEGGVVLVETGATGAAEVVEVEKAGKGGKPGSIKLKFIGLKPKGSFKISGDEEVIKLSGEIGPYKGKGKKLLSYLFIFGLFIKGGQGEVPTNVPHKATIAETILMESE